MYVDIVMISFGLENTLFINWNLFIENIKQLFVVELDLTAKHVVAAVLFEIRVFFRIALAFEKTRSLA